MSRASLASFVGITSIHLGLLPQDIKSGVSLEKLVSHYSHNREPVLVQIQNTSLVDLHKSRHYYLRLKVLHLSSRL